MKLQPLKRQHPDSPAGNVALGDDVLWFHIPERGKVAQWVRGRVEKIGIANSSGYNVDFLAIPQEGQYPDYITEEVLSPYRQSVFIIPQTSELDITDPEREMRDWADNKGVTIVRKPRNNDDPRYGFILRGIINGNDIVQVVHFELTQTEISDLEYIPSHGGWSNSSPDLTDSDTILKVGENELEAPEFELQF